MTAQDDQNFYEKKERLLRRVQAGTATQAQKEWLARWGFFALLLKAFKGQNIRTKVC